MPSGDYLWIAAGNYKQASDWVSLVIPKPLWRYIREAEDLHGHWNITVKIVGTFWDRADAEWIMQVLKSIAAEISDLTYHGCQPVDESELHKVQAELLTDLSDLKD